MRVLVDADSMPIRIREIIVGHAARRGFRAIFFANSTIPLPQSVGIELRTVDDADEAIVENVEPDDLVVTHDIPLAARLVEKGNIVLNDRGGRFTEENVRERLSRRDFAKELRDTGLLPERPRTFGPKEVQAFANAFDRELTSRGFSSGKGSSGR
ncbi:MAG: DUF188 domain-containing protein [Spirochaetia bacterium]